MTDNQGFRVDPRGVVPRQNSGTFDFHLGNVTNLSRNSLIFKVSRHFGEAQVELDTARYPIRRTPKRGLRQVDFVFDGTEIRGLEQNPDTKSRRAQMARSGKKVMQFLSEGRYVANVVDGKATLYGRRAGTDR